MKMKYLIRNKFPTPIEKEIITQIWHKQGFSCELFIDPPGREWNNFVHSTNELVTVVEGRLELTIEGESFIAEEGDEIFIPKHANHSVKNIHSSKTKWLYGYD